MVVVGLVFQQQESVKSELIEKSLISSYLSRRLLISKWSTMQVRTFVDLVFSTLQYRKNQINKSFFHARLRLFVSFLLPAFAYENQSVRKTHKQKNLVAKCGRESETCGCNGVEGNLKLQPQLWESDPKS